MIYECILDIYWSLPTSIYWAGATVRLQIMVDLKPEETMVDLKPEETKYQKGVDYHLSGSIEVNTQTHPLTPWVSYPPRLKVDGPHVDRD